MRSIEEEYQELKKYQKRCDELIQRFTAIMKELRESLKNIQSSDIQSQESRHKLSNLIDEEFAKIHKNKV